MPCGVCQRGGGAPIRESSSAMSLLGLLMLLVGGVVLGVGGASVGSDIENIVDNYEEETVTTTTEHEKLNCTVWQRFEHASSPDQGAATQVTVGQGGFYDCFLECGESCGGLEFKEAGSSCYIHTSDFGIQADQAFTQYRRLAGAQCPKFVYWEKDICCNIDRLYGYRGIVDAAFSTFMADNYTMCRFECLAEAWQCYAFDFEDTTGWCHLYDGNYSTQVEAFEWAAFYRFADCDQGFAPDLPSSPLGAEGGTWVETEFDPQIPPSPKENCAQVEMQLDVRADTTGAERTPSGSANLESCVEQCLAKDGCVAVQFDRRDIPENGVRCYTFTTAPAQTTDTSDVHIVVIDERQCPSVTQTIKRTDCDWLNYDNKAGVPEVGVATDFAELEDCMTNCKSEYDCWALDFTEQNGCVFYLEPAAYWMVNEPGTNHYVRTNCVYRADDLDIVISEGESHDEAQGQNTDALRD